MYSGRPRSRKLFSLTFSPRARFWLIQAVAPACSCLAGSNRPGCDSQDAKAGELQKEALAELLHRRKPIGHLTERSAADGKADILELIGRERSRLEPREAVQIGNFAKPVDCDKRLDPARSGIAVWIPYCC